MKQGLFRSNPTAIESLRLAIRLAGIAFFILCQTFIKRIALIIDAFAESVTGTWVRAIRAGIGAFQYRISRSDVIKEMVYHYY